MHKNSAIIYLSVIFLSGCGGYKLPSYRQSRAAERRSSRPVPVKGIKHTSLNEALTCKKYYSDQGDLDLSAKYLEHALTLAKEHAIRAELMLELADTYMKLRAYDKASKWYNQYKMVYPGSAKINYVLFQEMSSMFDQSLASNKDQTKTREVVKLAKQFLQEFSPNDAARQHDIAQVKIILKNAYKKLIEFELGLASFYLKRYSYDAKEGLFKAAHRRLSYCVKEYLLPWYDLAGISEHDKISQIADIQQQTPEKLLSTIKVIEQLIAKTD